MPTDNTVVCCACRNDLENPARQYVSGFRYPLQPTPRSPVTTSCYLAYRGAPTNYSDFELGKLLTDLGAALPSRIKRSDTAGTNAPHDCGWIEWTNVAEAAEAIMLANGCKVTNTSPPFLLKVCLLKLCCATFCSFASTPLPACHSSHPRT